MKWKLKTHAWRTIIISADATRKTAQRNNMVYSILNTSSEQDCFLIQGRPPHLVMRGHFRSRDKDGGYTIRSVVAKNLRIYTNFVALGCIKTGVITDGCFTSRE